MQLILWHKKIPTSFNAHLQQWIARFKYIKKKEKKKKDEFCQSMINNGSALVLIECQVKAYMFNWFVLYFWIISSILCHPMIFYRQRCWGLILGKLMFQLLEVIQEWQFCLFCHRSYRNEFSTSSISDLLIQPSK